MKKLLFLILLFVSASAYAQQGMELNLWPQGPQTSNGDPNDMAKISIFLPKKSQSTGRAIVICPGGGYTHLAFEKEGTAWAPLLQQYGHCRHCVEVSHASLRMESACRRC